MYITQPNDPAHPHPNHEGVSGMSKREHFASMANVTDDMDGWDISMLQKLLGRQRPETSDVKGVFEFYADAEATLKVMKADALIKALNQ